MSIGLKSNMALATQAAAWCVFLLSLGRDVNTYDFKDILGK